MTREAAAGALSDCRRKIDEVDLRILALLNERMLVVEEIGRIKRSVRLPIYEPKREDEVFHNVMTNNRGPLSADAVRRIFERIIDEARVVQRLRMESAAHEDSSCSS